MTTNELKDLRNRIEKLLKERRLFEAMTLLENCTKGAMLFELTDRVDKLKQTYAYMLKYLTNGVDDPDRNRMLSDTVAKCYDILDEYEVAIAEKDFPEQYYNVRRYNRRQQGANSITAIIGRLKSARKESTAMAALFAEAAKGESSISGKIESIETELFNAVWTSFPLNTDETKQIVELICSSDSSAMTSVRLTSALILAALAFEDTRVITALCDVYEFFADSEDSKSRHVAAATLIGLIFILYKYSDRTFPVSLKARIEALGDLNTWRSDVRIAFMELVRSRDTERISRTMTDEIIPQMMNMRPDIEKKIRDTSDEALLSHFSADNPEWQELFGKSGIEDKIKELHEMQMEGSDIYMSAFSHLKSFPFFNDIINWFTPFDDATYPVEKIAGKNVGVAEIASLFKSMPFLCDSDKFSILLSISMVPESNRAPVLNQLLSQRDEMMEMNPRLEGLTNADKRRNDVRNYIRNFYRFVNLYRRKGEFYNIFAHEINLFEVPLLKNALEDVELLQIVGEFYFRYKYYNEAITAFSILDKMGEFDSVLYQKLGYAYEKIGNLDNAIRFYEQADLLDNTSKWLRFRLADAYRKSSRFEEGSDILKQLAEQYPDDMEISLMAGYTYIGSDNYHEALKHLFKAEFLSPDDNRVLRPIAWSLFMVRDFERSEKYYNKLLLQHPIAEDYINMGHVALARSNFKEAVNYYKMFVLNNEGGKDMFFKTIDADKEHLRRAGVSSEIISLIADAMLSELRS